jgi:hypothetical protein
MFHCDESGNDEGRAEEGEGGSEEERQRERREREDDAFASSYFAI